MKSTEISQNQRKKAMRNAVIYTCLAIHGFLAFKNGVILLFLRTINVSDSRILVYLAIPYVALSTFRVPAAFAADRYGKKFLGTIGMLCGSAGFLIIFLSSFFSQNFTEVIIVMGITIFSIGAALVVAGWFALLDPIVPKEMRGRFFGKLRLSWQLAGVTFSGFAIWILDYYTDLKAFQILFAIVTVFLLVRMVVYLKIPELEISTDSEKKIKPFELLGNIIRTQGVASFGAYIFLITLCSSYCPTIFALMEKEVLYLGNGTVVWLANLTMIGSVTGFWLGGHAVDRFGTKSVFLVCHFSFPVILAIFLFRGFFPGIEMSFLWGAHFLFGIAFASSSIAITSEILGLIPEHHKSVATSLLMTFQIAGAACSGFLCAGVIKLNLLKEHWTLLNMGMNKYDTILLAAATMILMLTAALGLVPSVIRKSQWFPHLTNR